MSYPILFGNMAAAGASEVLIGNLSISNSSSTVSNYVFPATVTHSSLLTSNFSNLAFKYNGVYVQHWLGHNTPGVSAQVYIKLPSIPNGNTTVQVWTNPTATSSNSGMFNAFTNFAGASLGTGWEFSGANSGDYTLTEGNCRIINNNATGIIFVNTTSNQGQNVRVDNLAILRLGCIYENCVRFSKSNATLGIKYRWDGRVTNPPGFPEQDWLNNVYSGWANLTTTAPSQTTTNANGKIDELFIYQVKATGNNFFSYVNNVPTNKNYSSSASNFNQDGIAGVGNHYGPADLKWIAVYPAYANISEASYNTI